MKPTIKSLAFSALLGVLLAASLNTYAQTTPSKSSTDATETAKPKRDWYPFYGTVAAVDTKSKTVSLKKKEGERVLQTDAKTTFEQNGKPATLADVKAGNYLHGKLHKNAAKEEVILDAKIELQPPAKKSGTNEVAAAVVPATTDDASPNAPVKKKKKKAAPTP